MKIGAWIHGGDGIAEAWQMAAAAGCGMTTVRYYHYDGAHSAVEAIRETGMSLMAGMHVDGAALVRDWRSQVHLDELAAYHELGVPLEGICVGNELREGDAGPQHNWFTARLSFGLANVIDAYRRWIDDHGYRTPLTYAMEGSVFGSEGRFQEWMWPLIDACDIVSVNLYPMDAAAWFTFGAFDESRRLLHDTRERRLRFNAFELHLRRLLEQLDRANRPLILTETGFPSAVSWRMEEGSQVVPESDPARFEEAMHEFMGLIRRVNEDYDGRIAALYFYEWRDNPRHGAIEDPAHPSPIHCAFGLCDRTGTPKLDIRRLVAG